MPVTAPTSSAMVTTRIARLKLIFQLVMRFGTIAGNISLAKYCSLVVRNERTMRGNSRGTLRMASSPSIRKPGAAHDHLQPAAVHRGFENAGRLRGIDGDLVGGIGFLVQDVRHVLQGCKQHLGSFGNAGDLLRAQGRH